MQKKGNEKKRVDSEKKNLSEKKAQGNSFCLVA